jgi:hypothetical protein
LCEIIILSQNILCYREFDEKPARAKETKLLHKKKENGVVKTQQMPTPPGAHTVQNLTRVTGRVGEKSRPKCSQSRLKI